MKLFSEGGEVRLSDVKGRLSKEPRHLGGGEPITSPGEAVFSIQTHQEKTLK